MEATAGLYFQLVQWPKKTTANNAKANVIPKQMHGNAFREKITLLSNFVYCWLTCPIYFHDDLYYSSADVESQLKRFIEQSTKWDD